MPDFDLHTPDDAPEGSRANLAASLARYSRVPNLHAILAESPAALDAHHALFDAFERSSFTLAEQQMIYLIINREHGCAYCMAGHTPMALAVDVEPEIVEALREGTPPGDPRHEALRRFVVRMVEARGQVAPGEIDAFLAAGFTRAQVLEVIVAIAMKVVTSYTNHVTRTPHDPHMARYAWTPRGGKGDRPTS